MENHTPPPTLTLKQLQHIRHVVKAAGGELSEMIEIGGDICRIWDMPRKYFVPEIGTWLPLPNGHIWRLVEPVWQMPEPADPIDKALLEDIILGIQWFEIARREIIPERFSYRNRSLGCDLPCENHPETGNSSAGPSLGS